MRSGKETSPNKPNPRVIRESMVKFGTRNTRVHLLSTIDFYWKNKDLTKQGEICWSWQHEKIWKYRPYRFAEWRIYHQQRYATWKNLNLGDSSHAPQPIIYLKVDEWCLVRWMDLALEPMFIHSSNLTTPGAQLEILQDEQNRLCIQSSLSHQMVTGPLQPPIATQLITLPHLGSDCRHQLVPSCPTCPWLSLPADSGCGRTCPGTGDMGR